MPTIEQRLDKIIMDMDNSGLYDMREMATIIVEWNAAVEVLKVIADKSVYQLGNDIICEGCRKYASASAEVEHVSDCPVGSLLKLIAKMEGTDV